MSGKVGGLEKKLLQENWGYDDKVFVEVFHDDPLPVENFIRNQEGLSVVKESSKKLRV